MHKLFVHHLSGDKRRNEEKIQLPYLFEYKSHACVSRTPIFDVKNSTKFF